MAKNDAMKTLKRLNNSAKAMKAHIIISFWLKELKLSYNLEYSILVIIANYSDSLPFTFDNYDKEYATVTENGVRLTTKRKKKGLCLVPEFFSF